MIAAFNTPPPLAPGDRVRIVAPCGPFDRTRFEAGVARIRAAGLVPAHDDGLFSRAGYLAGDDARRLGELESALADPDARAIWIARGGYGAMRLLGALDPARVAAAGRWLIGFSDATALHALWQRAGLASIHAANVTTLATWSDADVDRLRALLLDGAGVTLDGRVAHGDGIARGPLLGGNIALLSALAGTGCLPDLSGAIVLLEEVREVPYRLDRMLTQLELAGVLEHAAGFAVGKLTACGPDDAAALDAVVERLARHGVPVLADLDVGHGESSAPLPLGVEATIDCAAGRLETAALDAAPAPGARAVPAGA